MVYDEIMRSLKWSTSNAAFVPEIDDEHKEIFEQVSAIQRALAGGAASPRIQALSQRLLTEMVNHFAHEERLMRAARYSAMRWHKRQHDNARKRAGQFTARINDGDNEAGSELVAYISSWLRDHTRLADRMLGAALRNHSLCKVVFRAGTKPADACSWFDTTGEKFNPARQPEASRQ
jgi:hemerythrin